MQGSDQWPLDNWEWVASLRGHRGSESQRHSHLALARYLQRVAYNYLLLRQHDVRVLTSFADEDLTALAHEFVQDFLVKLTDNDFALLDQYEGHGKFTSFAAVVLHRIMARELKKKSWTTREPRPQQESEDSSLDASAVVENMAEGIERATDLEKCMQTLSERERLVLVRNVVDGEGPQEIGKALGKSANAISILLFRVKAKLRNCLEKGNHSD